VGCPLSLAAVQRRPGPGSEDTKARVLAHLLVVQSRGFEEDVEQIDQILKEGSHWFGVRQGQMCQRVVPVAAVRTHRWYVSPD
jgi:hypothetical protein